MWLILTDPNDPLAPWLMEGLRRRTRESVQLLSSRDFLDNRHFVCQRDGEAYFELETHDGHFIDSRRVTGALNRLRSFSPQTVAHLPPGQRLDAVMTASALLADCLRALRCPVLNPPGAAAFASDVRLEFEWATLAAQAGLDCAARQGAPFAAYSLLPHQPVAADAETARVLVVGSVVLAPPDVVVGHRTSQACRRLSELARTPLLAIDLVRAARGEWLFTGADTKPDPSSFGCAALDAIAEAFQPSQLEAVGSASDEPHDSLPGPTTHTLLLPLISAVAGCFARGR